MYKLFAFKGVYRSFKLFTNNHICGTIHLPSVSKTCCDVKKTLNSLGNFCFSLSFEFLPLQPTACFLQCADTLSKLSTLDFHYTQ